MLCFALSGMHRSNNQAQGRSAEKRPAPRASPQTLFENVMNYIASFFAGVFICNCIPHLVCGLKGELFPTPFAKPRGVGDSSSLMNFLWGFCNVVVGVVLLASTPVQIGFDASFLSLLVGALLMGVNLSLHFGKVRSQSHVR